MKDRAKSGGRRAAAAGVSAAALVLGLAIAPVQAAPATANPAVSATAASTGQLFGDYLAGRHAQHTRNFSAAARWYEKALAADPRAPELIKHTFLMEISDGSFERAAALAKSELMRDPHDALAQLTIVIERLKAGDSAGALKAAEALPTDGLHRFVGPFALAWTRAAAGDIAGADTALQGLDKFNGFEPLKVFQLGLLYDYTGKPDLARQYFDKALAASQQLNWRLVEVIANFDRRHGRADQAAKLFQRFSSQSSTGDLALALAAARPAGVPQPIVATPADGLAEAMFDLASVLDQSETIDLALVYDRFALDLRPQFPLAQLLLGDILTADGKPEQALSVLTGVKPDSPYYWSAQLRAAVDLDALGRSNEAIAQLRSMASKNSKLIGAEIELGDILRNQKRFSEAASAYDEAIRREKAAGLPQRWILFYDRGVALERSGQWPRAEADLQHALKLKPDQPTVLNYLGYSWVDRGRNLKHGLQMIEKAVELRPDDGYIVDSLGWAHYRLGQYKDAVRYLEKATELVPEDPTINDHLGDAYWQTGRLVEARYQWRRALQFGPQKDEIKPIEAKLQHGLSISAQPPGGG
ncbi:MAG TPA: tetratricopeptide repeat protein [Stellaceae bacterium]|nr:tetratricopeptide repeat protein [Stellaceae bacterium]